MITAKTWARVTIVSTLAILMITALLTIIIDPYFHYHKPISKYGYSLYQQRYQNDGILRNYDYDAMITGTSMTENFKTTDLDELFSVNSVKTPFSGATFFEIDSNIRKAIKYNKELKLVVRGLDYSKLSEEPTAMRTDLGSYPEYLYDENLLNDASYILNKDVLINDDLKTMIRMQKKIPNTSFNEYSNWMMHYSFGKDSVLNTYTRPKKQTARNITKEENRNLIDNITKNVVETAKNNPQIDFYYYFTPYSICQWDIWNQEGILDVLLTEEQKSIEMILECDNIHLFSFSDDFSLICNLDNYKDATHYGEEINTYILKCMKASEHQITRDNYKEYCLKMRSFMYNYDFNAIYS